VTSPEATAIIAAKVQYDRARREHQRLLLTGTDQPLRHAFAYRRLIRFGPSETVVIREIG
jgi:hypothetical protein